VVVSIEAMNALLEAPPTWTSPAEFGLLAILAYRTNEEEGGVAWPTLAFLAKRLCMDPRSVRRMVAKLERKGVIRRVEQGCGRRASRYQLQVRDAHDPIPAESREDPTVPPERTVGSSLGTESTENSDSIEDLREDPEVPSERTDESPQRGPYGPPISIEKKGTEFNTAPAARFADKAKEPNHDNYRVILAIASEVLNEHQFTSNPNDFGNFVEEVKQRCANHLIDYGRHPDVAVNVVHRACTSALCARKFGHSQGSAR
jgi:DNA-binding Lrp family transcriptional regulator